MLAYRTAYGSDDSLEKHSYFIRSVQKVEISPPALSFRTQLPENGHHHGLWARVPTREFRTKKNSFLFDI